MQTRLPEHQDIFYPSDCNSIQKLCSTEVIAELDLPLNCEAQHLPTAVMAPHGAWNWVLPQMRQALRAVRHLKPAQIVLLCPLHQQVLEADAPAIAFLPSQDVAETPCGTISFATKTKEELLAKHGDSISVQDSYFTEEPAAETWFPLLQSWFEATPILPILATPAYDSATCRQLASLLKTIVEAEPQTLFIVSANMNHEASKEAAWNQAYQLQALLEQGSPLLNDCSRLKIGGCALQWLQAISKLNWDSQGWLMLSATEDSETFHDAIPSQPIPGDSKKPIVWHSVALHR